MKKLTLTAILCAIAALIPSAHSQDTTSDPFTSNVNDALKDVKQDGSALDKELAQVKEASAHNFLQKKLEAVLKAPVEQALNEVTGEHGANNRGYSLAPDIEEDNGQSTNLPVKGNYAWDVEQIKDLVRHGADLGEVQFDIKNSGYWNVLEYAAIYSKWVQNAPELIDYLGTKGLTDYESALYVAVESNASPAAIDALLKADPQFSSDHFFVAVFHGHVYAVRQMIAARPDIAYQKTEAGRNVMHFVAESRRNSDELLNVVFQALWLNEGKRINAAVDLANTGDRHNIYPLNLALHARNLEMAEVLISNFNVKTDLGAIDGDSNLAMAQNLQSSCKDEQSCRTAKRLVSLLSPH